MLHSAGPSTASITPKMQTPEPCCSPELDEAATAWRMLTGVRCNCWPTASDLSQEAFATPTRSGNGIPAMICSRRGKKPEQLIAVAPFAGPSTPSFGWTYLTRPTNTRNDGLVKGPAKQ
jgi:hypothetical protein